MLFFFVIYANDIYKRLHSNNNSYLFKYIAYILYYIAIKAENNSISLKYQKNATSEVVQQLQ